MNTKKLQDIKLIKNKLNAALVLIEEVQNLAEEWNIRDNYLVDAMDNLENQYWEIDDMEQELKQD